jgi:hypothetical protein
VQHSYEMQNFFQSTPLLFLQKINNEVHQFYSEDVLSFFKHHKNIFEKVKIVYPDYLYNYYYMNGELKQGVEQNNEFLILLDEVEKITDTIIEMQFQIENFGSNLNYFIPTLRTAHSLFDNTNPLQPDYKKYQKDIFSETISKNYDLEKFIINNGIQGSSEKQKKTYIFTGLKLYNAIINSRNGTKEERKRFDEFEKFIGKQFFNSDIDIVANFNYNEKHENKDDKETINIHIGESSRNLHDLGDGIQALIILMYSIFMAPDDTMIFIDEPELNLHPGMQRLFLDQITNNKKLTEKNLTYVIATHSNHLLDLAIEKDNISIYSFSKNEVDKFLIKNVNAGDNELLRELGVNNSSVFLANSSIWVEGISDRYYLKAFLIAYCSANNKQMPKEDIDFAFLEYAGSNLVHYDFNNENKNSINAYALNNRIFILADNDEGKEEKHKQLKKFAELNEDNLVYETTGDYREVENLLSEDIWKEVLIDFCRKTKTRNSESKDILQTDIKAKIKKKNLEDFKTKYIVEYLVALKIDELNTVYELSKSKPKSLKSEYKTLLSKMVLDKTINGELKWEHFKTNEKVVSLIENIYSFITSK